MTSHSIHPPSVSAIIRTALFVRDIERASAFYRDVFHITDIFGEGDLPQESIRTLLGIPKDSHVQYRIFQAEAHNKGMIGLFQVSSPTPPVLERDLKKVHLGEGCMVFYCADLDPVLERLREWDVVVIAEPTYFKFNETIGQREMVFRDIDGMLINLIERPVDDEG